LPKFDVVIVSDYGKGGMAHVQEMIQAARARGLPVVIDPKGDDYTAYRGATLITPNRKEFEQVAGRFRDDAELERKAAAMLDSVGLDGVLVTRSEEGMSLIDRTGRKLHVPAQAREVYDVTGAGDTVIAMIRAAYAAKGDIEEAMQLANIAAGIGVGRQGAVAVTRADIEHELMHYLEDRAEEA
jgi:rfaE bifunctional protein kinase chain/domain